MDCLFNNFFPSGLKSQEKNFVITKAWKTEIERWLQCIKRIDPVYYARCKTRVNQDIWKQEEVLAEIRSIYHIQINKECRVIAIEPNRVDFTFIDKGGAKWQAEVKCPSYIKELAESGLSKKVFLERKQKPKYIRGESFSFNFIPAYVDSISRTLPQFENEQNNLLIISDNRRINLIHDPYFKLNVKSESSKLDTGGKLSSVMLIHVECNIDGHILYKDNLTTLTKGPNL